MSLATMEHASTTSRAANGRFGFGHPGGPGNPHVRRIAAMRQAILAAVSPEDVRDILLALVALAKEGDREAAKFVLQYTLGKPGSWDPAADLGSVDPAEGMAPTREETAAPQAPTPVAANAVRPAALPPLIGEAARCEELLAARHEPRPELTMEQMLGLTPPSTNGANGPKGTPVFPAVAVVNTAQENGRRGTEPPRAAKK
jgi:hypothetical protein